MSWNVFLEGLGTYWEPRGLSGGHFGVVGLILGGLGVHIEAFGRPLEVFCDVLGCLRAFLIDLGSNFEVLDLEFDMVFHV